MSCNCNPSYYSDLKKCKVRDDKTPRLWCSHWSIMHCNIQHWVYLIQQLTLWSYLLFCFFWNSHRNFLIKDIVQEKHSCDDKLLWSMLKFDQSNYIWRYLHYIWPYITIPDGKFTISCVSFFFPFLIMHDCLLFGLWFIVLKIRRALWGSKILTLRWKSTFYFCSLSKIFKKIRCEWSHLNS